MATLLPPFWWVSTPVVAGEAAIHRQLLDARDAPVLASCIASLRPMRRNFLRLADVGPALLSFSSFLFPRLDMGSLPMTERFREGLLPQVPSLKSVSRNKKPEKCGW
jgi:hypothetical protein